CWVSTLHVPHNLLRAAGGAQLHLVDQKGVDVGVLLDLLAESRTRAVAAVHADAQEHGLVRACGGLKTRRHLARVSWVDAAVVLAREQKDSRVGGSLLDVLIRPLAIHPFSVIRI